MPDNIHVLIVNYAYDDGFQTPMDLISSYFLLTNWAKGLHENGLQVTVFQRFSKTEDINYDGVSYQLVSDHYKPNLRFARVPWELHRMIRRAAMASLAKGQRIICHVNGFIYPIQSLLLRTSLPRACPMVMQHHAERPWGGAKGIVQQLGMRMSKGFFFTNNELSLPWVNRKYIQSAISVYSVMEATSAFKLIPKPQARKVTKMAGQPVILWTGNLKNNKDPITILKGFNRILKHFPHAMLYMAFKETTLLPKVEEYINQQEKLANSVQLLGTVPHSMLGDYYNSADAFVQGSYREGSGIALLEALSCGAVPVVTDISSFRTITGNGQVGALWKPGDCDSFSAALEYQIRNLTPHTPQLCHRFFVDNWSPAAIGKVAFLHYQKILDRMNKHSP